MGRLAKFRIVLMLAWRNLFNHWGKNLIVGIIMLFGTFLVVMGTSLLDSIEFSMTRSITASVAGHLQVYDEKARDELALFGSGFMGQSDIGSIPDYHKVKQVLGKVQNVKAIVPMGTDVAEFYSSTQLDRTIDAYRKAVEREDGKNQAAYQEKIKAMAGLMEEEFGRRLKILSNKEEVEKQLADIRTVRSDEFWQDAETAPHEVVEFLDTRLAPLVDENDSNFIRYLGTDLHLFAQHFDTFKMVSGEMVPEGHRGLLVSQKFYDDQLRNRVAREMDDLFKEVTFKGKTIKKDPMLQNQVQRMKRQYRRITYQLEPDQVEGLGEKLKEIMPGAEGDIDQLVQAFLEVDDQNLVARHKFFFDEIAPLIQLYLFDVGEVITIRAYTKSGYIKSANVKVYGTFSFEGLESSDLAGAFSLLDIMTFRDLYGMMTKEKREELEGIQKAVGLADVKSDDAEDALFGGAGEIETEKEKIEGFDEFEGVDLKLTVLDGKAVHDTTYDQEAVDKGMALNAALILENPDRLEETRAAVEKAIADNGLGLQVVDWQAASGIVGQMVVLVRVLLYIAITIIFLVALVIINNTMVMATMERTMEIGTVRAIGGQRGFVLGLFLLETLLLGALAGLLGAFLGAAFIGHLGKVGIPAVADILVFLFSGPKLFPTVGVGNLVIAGVVILLVSLIATFYPAFIATRIQPVVAMQARE